MGYLDDDTSQSTLAHFLFLLKKQALRQDAFLVGAPGPARRRLVLKFAELTGRRVRYVAIHPDTSESDLKQRREIVGGDVVFKPAQALLAAIGGDLLVLDGVEKAERNVLPLLNNLLENREMALEDGTFLTDRDDVSDNDERFVRCHPDFMIIALGAPTPAYPGNPLDPPFRSRFQSRDVRPSHALASTLPADFIKLAKLINALEIDGCRFADTADELAHKIWRAHPSLSVRDVIDCLLPRSASAKLADAIDFFKSSAPSLAPLQRAQAILSAGVDACIVAPVERASRT